LTLANAKEQAKLDALDICDQDVRSIRKQNCSCNRPWRRVGCETSRMQHFLDDRLIDGGEDVSLTRRQAFISREIRGTHLC
jgi:hypothetical protein